MENEGGLSLRTILKKEEPPRSGGSDGSMPASSSAGPGFDPRRGSKFLFENFQHRG